MRKVKPSESNAQFLGRIVVKLRQENQDLKRRLSTLLPEEFATHPERFCDCICHKTGITSTDGGPCCTCIRPGTRSPTARRPKTEQKRMKPTKRRVL